MMNKILLLLLVASSMLFAGEEEGTATTPNNTTSNTIMYQLVCVPATEENRDNNLQDPIVNCAFVEAHAED